MKLTQRRAYATMSRFAEAAILAVEGHGWDAIAERHATTVPRARTMVRKIMLTVQRYLEPAPAGIDSRKTPLLSHARLNPSPWITEIRRLADLWKTYAQQRA